MSKRKYRMYSDEFKRNALELAKTSDKSDAQIERDRRMSAGLLSRWRKRYQVSEESNGVELSEAEQLKAECVDQRFTAVAEAKSADFRRHDGLVQSPTSPLNIGLSQPRAVRAVSRSEKLTVRENAARSNAWFKKRKLSNL